MYKGEARQELRTTQPEQPTEDFLLAAIVQAAEELGISITEAAPHLKVTYNQISSPQLDRPIPEHRLAVLWYRDSPVATSLETRTEFNQVLTQTTYFGTSYHETG